MKVLLITIKKPSKLCLNVCLIVIVVVITIMMTVVILFICFETDNNTNNDKT